MKVAEYALRVRVCARARGQCVLFISAKLPRMSWAATTKKNFFNYKRVTTGDRVGNPPAVPSEAAESFSPVTRPE